jgi:integrase
VISIRPSSTDRGFAPDDANTRGNGPTSGSPLLELTATLPTDGVPVLVVSERLSHASATITLTVYQHVHPGMGREAADRFAAPLES